MMKQYRLTILLGILLLILSLLSLFTGVISIDLNMLLTGTDTMVTKIFLLSRIPRLLAILCTGAGMSVSGLLMQQLCRNKFVYPVPERPFSLPSLVFCCRWCVFLPSVCGAE